MNVRLRCLCGWEFFAPRTAPAFVNCPQCGAPVLRSGAGAAGPSALPDPVPRASRRGLWIIACAAALVLLAAEVTLFVFLSRPQPAPVAGPAPATLLSPAVAPDVDRPVQAPPTGDYVDVTQRLNRMAAQSNMAGIAGAILLESGRVRDHAELEDRMRVFDREIRALDRLRTERGTRAPLPVYFQAGDRLAALSARVRDPAQAVVFAEELKDWLRSFRAGARESATVVREGKRITFEMDFPERTKELNLLAQRTGIMLGEGRPDPPKASQDPSAAPSPPAAPPPVPAPPSYGPLLAETDKKVSALHSYYRGCIQAGEAERLRQAALQGFSADPEELRYKTRVELLESFAREQQAFAARIEELEKDLPTVPAPQDLVTFKDGRKIEGTVEEQTDQSIRVRSRLGAATFPAEEILRIEKGKGAVLDFHAKWQNARGKPPELQTLLDLCRQNRLPVHAEMVANALLSLDPGHEAARTDAGFTRLSGGTWVRPNDPRLKDEALEWRGQSYTPDQLRQHLRSLGYVSIGNLWYEKVPATFRIDNLYRDGNLKYIRGTIQSLLRTEQDTFYDVKTKAWLPRTKTIEAQRYLAGGALEVEFPGPLLECRVKARGLAPKLGDAVSVSVRTTEADVFPKLLYRLNSPGENTQSYDVTEKTLGRSRLVITATTIGGGMFLPCDANDLAVFEVKYAYGKPIAKVNELFAARAAPAPPPQAAPLPLTATQANASGLAETHARITSTRIPPRANLAEALDEIRKLMDGHLYYRELEVPARYALAVEVIHDPRQPLLDTSPRDKVLHVAGWWSSLPPGERADFASFCALWGARLRAQGK